MRRGMKGQGDGRIESGDGGGGDEDEGVEGRLVVDTCHDMRRRRSDGKHCISSDYRIYQKKLPYT